MRSHRRKQIALCLFVVLGPPAFLWLIAPKPPVLLERAKPLSVSHVANQDVSYYDWLSLDEILYFKQVRDGSEEIFRVHTKDGQVVPLEKLNAHRYVPQRNGSSRPYWMFERSLSPNRKSLYWEGQGEQSYLASSLDGSHSDAISDMNPNNTQRFWQKDGKRLASFLAPQHPGEEATVKFFSTDTPQNYTVERIHGLQESTTVIGFLDDTHLLTMPSRPFYELAGKLVLKQYAIGRTVTPPRTIICPVPIDASGVREVLLSPAGDRIAWFMDFEQQASYPPWMWFVRYSFFRIERCATHTGLWTSRVDGTDIQELGRLIVGTDSYGGKDPEKLRWLPDGKALSFVYDNTLWTIDAAPATRD